MLFLRTASIILGVALVASTLLSAIKTFVVPRSVNPRLTGVVFELTARLFRAYLRLRRINTYLERDAILAVFAPISLLLLVFSWFALVIVGYSGIFWGLGVQTMADAIILSGSSLLTLGFATPDGLGAYLIVFSEGAIGLGLMALLIAYLPTMYSAFSEREREVSMLEVRAGDPPWAITMIERYHRLHDLEAMGVMWEQWEAWFSDIEESHTSLGALIFFRSPKAQRSWVTAAGAVLDGAALYASTLNVPQDARANLCIRAGYLALRSIADYFNVPYNPAPGPADPITIGRSEFDEAYNRLAAQGIPMVADQERAWLDFKGWRVNYDVPLVALARLTFAPYAPWSSDRSYIGASHTGRTSIGLSIIGTPDPRTSNVPEVD